MKIKLIFSMFLFVSLFTFDAGAIGSIEVSDPETETLGITKGLTQVTAYSNIPSSFASVECLGMEYPIINRLPGINFYHKPPASSVFTMVRTTETLNVPGQPTVFGSTNSEFEILTPNFYAGRAYLGSAPVSYLETHAESNILTHVEVMINKDVMSRYFSWFYQGENVQNAINAYIYDVQTPGVSEPRFNMNKYVPGGTTPTRWLINDINQNLTLYIPLLTDVTNTNYTVRSASHGMRTATSAELNDGGIGSYLLKGAGIHNGTGTANSPIDKGDILVLISSQINEPPDPFTTVLPRETVTTGITTWNDTETGPIYLHMLTATESNSNAVIIDHGTNAGYWTSYYIVKPIYVPETVPNPVSGNSNIVIPDYMYSDLTTLDCSITHWTPGFGSPIVRPLDLTPVPTVNCDNIRSRELPDTRYGLLMDNDYSVIIPGGSCTNAPFERPIDIDTPGIDIEGFLGPHAQFHVGDLVTSKNLFINPAPFFHVNNVPNVDADVFYMVDMKDVNEYGPENAVYECGLATYSCQPCVVRFEPSGITTNEWINIDERDETLQRLELENYSPNGFDKDYPVHESATITCNDLGIVAYNTVTRDYVLAAQVAPGTSAQIGMLEPFYLQYIQAINSNQWGWGTRNNTDSDVTEPNQNIMGMPLVGLLALLSAYAGFNRRWIIPSVVIYMILIGSFSYLQLIDIPTAIISGMVMLAIIVIFSKGFR